MHELSFPRNERSAYDQDSLSGYALPVSHRRLDQVEAKLSRLFEIDRANLKDPEQQTSVEISEGRVFVTRHPTREGGYFYHLFLVGDKAQASFIKYPGALPVSTVPARDSEHRFFEILDRVSTAQETKLAVPLKEATDHLRFDVALSVRRAVLLHAAKNGFRDEDLSRYHPRLLELGEKLAERSTGGDLLDRYTRAAWKVFQEVRRDSGTTTLSGIVNRPKEMIERTQKHDLPLSEWLQGRFERENKMWTEISAECQSFYQIKEHLLQDTQQAMDHLASGAKTVAETEKFLEDAIGRMTAGLVDHPRLLHVLRDYGAFRIR